MKNFLFLAVLATLIYACGGSNLKNKIDFEVNIDRIDSNSYRQLSDFKIKTMSAKIIALDSSFYFKSYFEDLKKIDSLKRTNQYNAFLDGLKPGIMADGGAYQVKTLHKSKTERYELWKLQYITLEASPYFYGSHVFLSFYRNDSLKSTYEIANNRKSGNSPNSLATKANAHIKSDSVLVSMTKITKVAEKSDTVRIEKLLRVK